MIEDRRTSGVLIVILGVGVVILLSGVHDCLLLWCARNTLTFGYLPLSVVFFLCVVSADQ